MARTPLWVGLQADPHDRLLLAQSQTEPLTLLTVDARLGR